MRLLIVNFHYYREGSFSSGIYPINRNRLNKQIDVLGKYYQFISQSEILNLIHNREYPAKNYCLITLDDGLKEQLDAFEFLRSKGVPAILFVPTYPIRKKKVLTVHKLHYVRTIMNDIDIYDLLEKKYKISDIKFDDLILQNQYRYDDMIGRKVKYFLNFILNEGQKEEAVNHFFSQLVNDEQSFAKRFYLDEDDLKYLANDESLGSHGEKHIPLAAISIKEAIADIQSSIKYLEALTGHIIYSFSYPYGGDSAVTDSLAEAFKETHIRIGLTTNRGINKDDDFSRPLFLKRVDTNDAPGGKDSATDYIPDNIHV